MRPFGSSSALALGIGLVAILVLADIPLGANEHAPAPRADAGSREAPASQTLRLEIRVVTGHDDGRIFCALWSEAEYFPVAMQHAAHEGSSEGIVDQQASVAIDGVAPGEYALACFHDENANNALDTNFLGIPSEGTGASNAARGFMGPPRYEDARFSVTADGPTALRVEIDY